MAMEKMQQVVDMQLLNGVRDILNVHRWKEGQSLSELEIATRSHH